MSIRSKIHINIQWLTEMSLNVGYMTIILHKVASKDKNQILL